MSTQSAKSYTVHAGNNSTDLGRVGYAITLTGAKRIGRAAVQSMLPNGEGSYTIRDAGRDVMREERSVRTGLEWVQQ